MESFIYTPSQDRLPQLQNGLNLSSTIVLHEGLLEKLPTLEAGTLQRIILEPSNLSELNQTALHDLYKALKPDGLLEIHYTTESGDINTLKDLHAIAGFKEESSNGTTLVLKKPSWAGKGVATLKKKAAPTGNAVKVNMNDDDVKLGGEEQKTNPFAKFSAQAVNNKEIIDEDNLLDNEASYNRLGADESCSTKPKACANCSCGRAEQEALEAQGGVDVSKKIETGNVASSCGNCYLGDAFRCGSCPYRGLPAFKPGDKVKLDLSKDGFGGVLKEENDVVVSNNGKVKLQI